MKELQEPSPVAKVLQPSVVLYGNDGYKHYYGAEADDTLAVANKNRRKYEREEREREGREKQKKEAEKRAVGRVDKRSERLGKSLDTLGKTMKETLALLGKKKAGKQ